MTQSPGIAALLSFLWPGVGQIYNGQIITGFLLVVLSFIFAMLCFVIIGIPFYIMIWVLAVYDAYHTAERKAQ